MSTEAAGRARHLRWVVVDWASRYDSGEPAAWRIEEPLRVVAERLLVLLALICDLPSGEITDYSYADWARVLGVTEEEALAAADILAAWDVSWRSGELGRGGTGTRCRINIPPEVLAGADAWLELDPP